MGSLRSRLCSTDAVGQAFRYLLIGGSGYLLAIAFYALEIAVGVAPYPAIAAVFVANGLYNFLLARRFAFPSSGRRAGDELTRFIAVAGLSLAINYSSFALLHSGLGLPPTPSQAVAIFIAAPFGFLANRHWSFRRAPEG